MSRGLFTAHIREERRSCTRLEPPTDAPGLLPRTGARPGLAPGGRRPIPPRPGRDSQPNHPQARGSRCQPHLHLRRGARLAAGVPTVRARRWDLVPAGDSRATSPILRVRLVHSLSYARVSSASPWARSGALVGDARREAGRSLAGHHGRTAVLGPNAARNDCGVQRDSLVIQCTRPLDVVGDCVNRRCDRTQIRGDPDHGRDANQAHERPSPAGLVRQASPAPFRSVPGIHPGRHCGCGMPMAASRSCCTTAPVSEMTAGRRRDDHPGTQGATMLGELWYSEADRPEGQ